MSSRAYFQIPSVEVGFECTEDLDAEHDHHGTATRPRQSRMPGRRLVLGLAVVVPWSLLMILSVWVLFQHRQRGPQNPIFPQMLYSPAQGALEYEVRRFHLSLPGDTTEYQGPPSPELDKRWSDLYEMGISLIDREDAARLHNKTVIFPHDPERRHVIELDVFHQLHCLNMWARGHANRKAMDHEYRQMNDPLWPETWEAGFDG